MRSFGFHYLFLLLAACTSKDLLADLPDAALELGPRLRRRRLSDFSQPRAGHHLSEHGRR
jgi:hypothetical protein